MIPVPTPRRTVKHAGEPGLLASGLLLAAPSHPYRDSGKRTAFATGYSGGGRAGFAPASLTTHQRANTYHRGFLAVKAPMRIPDMNSPVGPPLLHPAFSTGPPHPLTSAIPPRQTCIPQLQTAPRRAPWPRVPRRWLPPRALRSAHFREVNRRTMQPRQSARPISRTARRQRRRRASVGRQDNVRVRMSHARTPIQPVAARSMSAQA